VYVRSPPIVYFAAESGWPIAGVALARTADYGRSEPAAISRSMTTVRLFLYVFGVIFIAELPDKTALAALVLATHLDPVPVFLGAAMALTVQSVVAVGAGSVLSLLPIRVVHLGSGLLFLISAIFMWRRKSDASAVHWTGGGAASAPPTFRRALWIVFVIVFLAEWGDLTQLGTAALAAHYRDPVTVFSGAMCALWAVTALAVLAGNRAGKLIDPARTKKVAAVVFVLVGALLLIGII
jgi:putative Ca2+/H+ antiporter (TMEM165/GDT1 family)